jgi:signal transduction histidine kinase
MDRIADSAIQLVREETSSDKIEIVNLDEVVGRVCEDLAVMKFAVVRGDCDGARASVAPLAFVRALRNLIINAATHGAGARVTVQLRGSRCAVVIEDVGPGIPEHLIASVFEPFFRVDPARRQQVPGAGLGLAIAKEIIEKSNGTLVIENRKPRGLRQLILLPSAERESRCSYARRDDASEREITEVAIARTA